MALLFVGLWAYGPAASGAEDPWPPIRQAYLEGDFNEAIARLERLLAVEPTNREAYYYMGMIRWRQGDIPRAAEAYRMVWRLDPDGVFGRDAKLWLDAYASRGVIAPVALPSPTPAPAKTPRFVLGLRPKPAPSPHMTTVVVPFKPRATPTPTPRPHVSRPRPGYFKAADGSFEFRPPQGFTLLDEGRKAHEAFALFGVPGSRASDRVPPTLLITWREVGELKKLTPSQRAARERQLLAVEASAYGPHARKGAYGGGPCMRVLQKQGAWRAETLLFFQHGRLYAMTYGGNAEALARHRGAVDASWRTPIFYP